MPVIEAPRQWLGLHCRLSDDCREERTGTQSAVFSSLSDCISGTDIAFDFLSLSNSTRKEYRNARLSRRCGLVDIHLASRRLIGDEASMSRPRAGPSLSTRRGTTRCIDTVKMSDNSGWLCRCRFMTGSSTRKARFVPSIR